MFQTLSNAEISPRERLRPRGLTRGQRYGGSIARMDRSFGYVRRDIANDLVYSREDGDHKLDFSALKVGQRVTYSLGFNFRGPIAMEIDSEGVSKRPLVGASARECDVGILVALREEFRELIAAIGSNYVVDRDKETANTYYVFDHPHGRPEARRCVATMIGEMGPDKAVLLGERFIAKWKPDVLVVVGIAASLSSDLCVGDVCLAVQVDSYLEAGKAENKNGDSDAEDFVLKPGGAAYRVNKGMVEDVRNLEFAEPRIFEAWQQRGQQRLGKAIATDVRERLVAAGLARAAPVLEDCYLASGPVVGAGSAFVSWILRRDRRYKALDMESGGAMIAAAERAVPQRMVVVRGISDFGDERKTQLDKVGDGALRRYAMQNAIDFVFALVENGILESEA